MKKMEHIKIKKEIVDPKKSRRKTRCKKFSQRETDLLCRLVLSSDFNTLGTNKMPIRGSLADWKEIARVYNASTGIQQRNVKMLKERLKNIRRDLKKLSQYNGENGSKPPKVSFEPSEVVRNYAESIQMKLTGLPQIENFSSSSSSSSSSSVHSVHEFESNSSVKSPQLFGTQNKTKSRKSSFNERVSEPLVSPKSSQAFGAKYYESKATLIAGENRRRDELHRFSVDLMKEELAIKKKQSEVWDFALTALQNNSASISDIVNLTNVMQTSPHLDPTPY